MKAVRKPAWGNIIFFVSTNLLGIVATPIYLMHQGPVSGWIWVLFGFYVIATGMSITVGYHRLYAHTTFKASKWVHVFVLFFGGAAFEQSALDWSSQHRDHHRYVDTDDDPYSIKKGFWYAHIGWLLFWRHTINHDNCKDLQKQKLVVWQNKFYFFVAFFSGIILPTLLGALFGQALAAFLIVVCLRLTLVHHATFCINSVCHMFGKSTYDIYASARDHWFAAFLTNGEGYHNFHHRFPTDYRNGVRWYQWDPSKWMIWFLSKIGLAYDLKRVSKFQILQARFEAERQRLFDQFDSSLKTSAQWKIKASHMLNQKYETLLHTLAEWEKHAKEYRAELLHRTAERSEEWKALAQKNLENARQRFLEARREWKFLIRNTTPISA